MGTDASSKLTFDLVPQGDQAVVVRLGTEINLTAHHLVRSLSIYLDHHPFPGMVEYVPAFTTVTIYYDTRRLTYKEAEEIVRECMHNLEHEERSPGRIIRIPVCYGGDYGPDLTDVARHNGLSEDEVVQIHTTGEYLVYMIGFAPGFPYLGGLSERIATPRLSTPRLSIPAGSVGIAGGQTGVYPISTPGGWRLIGRTPLALFRPNDTPPSLLAAGDMVRFYSVSEDEYHHLQEQEERI